jgi:putative CocE/NonD family hydrolase
VLFDNGAGGSNPGEPYPGYERSFPRFPVPGTTARSWYFSGGGALSDARPSGGGADSFTWDADAVPPTDFTGDTAAGEGGLWTATPPYGWAQHPEGTAVSYLSEPLGSDTTVVGAGAVRAWIRSSRRNVDLQATVTEVRPDGKEVYVQSGWLRANERRLDRRHSTPLEPVLSLRKRDVRPLPRTRFVRVTIPLYYQGHAYRAGSRIRVTISAPDGDQPIWAFAKTSPKGTASVAVARSERRPSRLVLPVVRDATVPTGLPPCPGLRGEPCRDYEPLANRPAER